jgi:thiamine-monophosphate kinase
MDEWTVLAELAERHGVGDDCAVLPGAGSGGGDLLLTTDMLHDATDFPGGVTRETMGWRAAAASLSDVAAMGGMPVACVLAAGSPEIEAVETITEGAAAVCDEVGCRYAGGDVDRHGETTLASTVLGRVGDDAAVRRSGASAGDALVVTGSLGRTAVGLRAFQNGDVDRGDGLFRFTPRVAEGRALAPLASAMIDSSDGLAVSLHQLADASGVGFAVEEARLPAIEDAEGREDLVFTGEDYELVATVPRGAVDEARDAVEEAGGDARLTVIGDCVAGDDGVTMNGDPLPRRGYEH